MSAYEQSVRRELEERAALMCRLNYRKELASQRLRAYLRWEYERNPPVPFLKEIDKLVDRVFKRGGSTRHGDPSLE